MRIISGKYRGKPLKPPKGYKTRPTTDRVKETLFSILGSLGAIEGATVLDLFCGSGALGIEALSRGASSCDFNDIERGAVAVTKDNLSGITGDYHIYNLDYKKAIKVLADKKYSLIFLDPPYKLEGLADLVRLASMLLVSDGIIVLEHDKRKQVAIEGFSIDTRVCGETAISILSLLVSGTNSDKKKE